MTKRAAALAAGVTLALVVSACGSSGNGSENAGAAQSISPASSGQQSSSGSPAGSAQESGAGSETGGGSAAASGEPSGSAQGSSSQGSSQGSSADSDVCTGKTGDRDPDHLVLALVPSGNAKKLVESVKPLTKALTKSLGIDVKGVVTQDYQAAVEAMGANQADIGFLPSLQMSQACEKYGAVPALQTLRNGKSTYAAEFFTNKPDKYCDTKPKDNGKGLLYCNGTADGNGPVSLDSIKKIKGAKMVFLQAASPAGYIFPAADLEKRGIDPDKDVTPIQVTSNNASVLAVYNGDAEVGAAYWDARTVVQSDTPDVGKKVVVFALTQEIPNDGVSINGSLSKKWQDKIKKALMDFASTADGKKTLESIYQITGLQPSNPKKLQETQDVARSLGLG